MKTKSIVLEDRSGPRGQTLSGNVNYATKPTQPTHSPLPFKTDDCGVIWTQQNGEEPCIALTQPLPSASWLEPEQAEANAQFIVRACNNAERLAEALRDVTTAAEIVDGCETPDNSDIEHMLDCFAKAHEALAQWEAGL